MHTVAEHKDQSNYVMWSDSELSKRDDWLISSLGRTRDSGLIEESNWAVAVAALEAACGAESMENGWIVVNDSHWAVGWVEHFAVAPGSAAAAVIEDLEAQIEDYPILDESDYSDRESEAYSESFSDALKYAGVDAEHLVAIRDWLDQSEDWSEEYDRYEGWVSDKAIRAACAALGIESE